jgi:hypothetical protein
MTWGEVVTDEVFLTPCRPHVTRQMVECIGAEGSDGHAVHRKLTELVHYLCNCGFSSGWVPAGTMPQPSDFMEEHAPSQEIRDIARRTREWAERHHA